MDTSPATLSYNRRKSGADTLKYTLNHFYTNDNIVILGDFNDDLDQSITPGFTTSWDAFTTDSANYKVVTLPLSLAGKTSTVSYNDVIDHVVISNEMQPYYMDSTAFILNDVASLVSDYGSTTADHYPVFTRYVFKDTPPSITSCPSVPSRCTTNDSTYTIPTFTASDDCGSVGYSFVISGATGRTGNTNNASGKFNNGTSLITWTATDGSGNANTCQTTVVIKPNPTVKVNSPAKCVNDAAVTITATPSPAGSYNYSWVVPPGVPNPGNVASFAATVAGVYNVVITNSTTGCTASDSATLSVNMNPTVTVNSLVKCAANPALAITATPSPAGLYNYAWSVPIGVPEPGNVASFAATVAGTYSVVITNPNTGCPGSGSGMLRVNVNPIVTIPDAFALGTGVLANTVYIGYSPASSITLRSKVSGGTPAYSYNWSGGSAVDSATVSPTTNTTYNLTVIDANGCQASATKTITAIVVKGITNMDNILICHKSNSQTNTLEVAQNTVFDHLSHGDLLGSCNTSNSPAELVVTGFPNPSSGSFIVTIEGGNVSEIISVKVTNMSGRTVEQIDNLFTNQSFRIGHKYLPGLYFLEVFQGNRRKSIKLLKLY